MKSEAKVQRAQALMEQFERRVAKKRVQEEDKKEKKRRKIEEEAEMEAERGSVGSEKQPEQRSSTRDMIEKEKRRLEKEEEEAEGGGGKRVRVGGMEVREALERIEVWINEVRLEWENAEKEEDEAFAKACDDIRRELKVEDVRKARKEDIEYMKKRGLWKLVKVEESWQRTGRAPIGTRWVDTNKGSEEDPDVRSRLVARDFKGKGDVREDLFAAIPPAEAERMALSKAVTWSRTNDGRRRKRKIRFIDAKKAHLNPHCEVDVYVTLPEEAEAEEGMCGKLIHWLYGCRPAAQALKSFTRTSWRLQDLPEAMRVEWFSIIKRRT